MTLTTSLATVVEMEVTNGEPLQINKNKGIRGK